MRLEALLHFYRQRLRTHRTQELLAGAGIAVGVALVFAVVVANTSISTSARQIVHGIAGNAKLQLDARDENGFSADMLEVVRSQPSVEHAVGVLEQRAMLSGTDGRASVVLFGVDASLAQLGGHLTRDFISGHGLILGDGLLVPQQVANGVGVASSTTQRDGSLERTVTMRLRGRAYRAPVAAVLGEEVIGQLAESMVVVAPLSYVQRLAGLPNRITRVLVQPRPEQLQAARRQLEAVAAGRITVAPVDMESRILAEASAPNDQSTSLFAAISAIVGLLLAFNAMLLTVPERRRAIAEFRTHGYTPRQIVTMVMFEALLLGAVASAVGIGLGWLLAKTVFGGVPTYLAFAFPLGAQQAIPATTVVLVFFGGVLATFLAAAQPLLDLVPGRAPDAVYREEGEPGQGLSARTQRRFGAAAIGLLLTTTLLVGLLPAATVFGVAALALSALLILPAALAFVIATADRIARARPRLNMLSVALMALRATRVRALALAATGAVAVFGSVAVEGAKHDLVSGLHHNFGEYLYTTDLWITTGDDDLATANFRADDVAARIRALPSVAAVRPYFGGLLDIGDRRVWVIARAGRDHGMIPGDQIAAGDVQEATRSLQHGGAVAVSSKIADAQNAGVGDTIALPTPTGPRRFRIAATLNNLGWGPGAVILNAADYRRAWAASDPTAIEIDLKPGTSAEAAKRDVEQALGPGVSLRVQTASERAVQYDELAGDGLKRLTQISILLLLAATVALATATGAAIWQRRSAFADYRMQGFMPGQLWSSLLLESGIVLATGCAVGAGMGVYGQFLLGRWLRLTTDFPAPFSASLAAPLATFAIVVTAALFVVAIPSYRAVRSPLDTGLQH